MTFEDCVKEIIKVLPVQCLSWFDYYQVDEKDLQSNVNAHLVVSDETILPNWFKLPKHTSFLFEVNSDGFKPIEDGEKDFMPWVITKIERNKEQQKLFVSINDAIENYDFLPTRDIDNYIINLLKDVESELKSF